MFALHRYLPQHTKKHSTTSRRRSSFTRKAGRESAPSSPRPPKTAATSAAPVAPPLPPLSEMLTDRCCALASDYTALEDALSEIKSAAGSGAPAAAPDVVAHIDAGARLMLLALQHLAAAEEQVHHAIAVTSLQAESASAVQAARAAASAASTSASAAAAALYGLSARADVAGLLRRNAEAGGDDSSASLFPGMRVVHSSNSLQILGELAANAEKRSSQNLRAAAAPQLAAERHGAQPAPHVLDVAALRPDPDAAPLTELDPASLARAVARMRTRSLDVWTAIDARLPSTQPWGRAIARVADAKCAILSGLDALLASAVARYAGESNCEERGEGSSSSGALGRSRRSSGSRGSLSSSSNNSGWSDAGAGAGSSVAQRRSHATSSYGVLETSFSDFVLKLNAVRDAVRGVHHKEAEIFVHAMSAAADDAGVATTPLDPGLVAGEVAGGGGAGEPGIGFGSEGGAVRRRLRSTLLDLAGREFQSAWKDNMLALEHAMASERLAVERFATELGVRARCAAPPRCATALRHRAPPHAARDSRRLPLPPY